MEQEYHVGIQVLETGTELVSPHLRWLIRNMLLDYLGVRPLDMVAYHVQTPDEKFGEAVSPCRAVVVNLIKHFDEILPSLEEDTTKYSSLKCILLKELLDTMAHEGHHLKASDESDDWSNSVLEEDAAKEAGEYLSWRVAKKYDVEIDRFGPLLDDAIDEFIEGLRVIAKDAEDKNEIVEEWVALQIHMYDNRLAYYHPETDKSLSFRQAFELGAGDEDPWIDDFKTFIEELPTKTDESEEATSVTQPVEVQPTPVAPVVTPVGTTVPVTAAPLATAPANPVINTEVADVAPVMTAPAGIGAINDELNDAPMPDDMSSGEYQDVPAVAAPTAVTTPAGFQQPAAAQAAVAPVASSGPMITVETVIRRLFHHVSTKCEFNSEGGYNNPYAVLEDVSIADIPGATELFVAMDTTDATGKFSSQTACSGVIKGLVSQAGLPRYTLYLNMNGQLHKRTFIAQNPKKVDASGQNLTKWAQAAQNGDRIMMLLQDGVGIRANVKLSAGQALGQEEWKVWEQK